MATQEQIAANPTRDPRSAVHRRVPALHPDRARPRRLRNSTQKAFRETLAELRSLQAEHGSALACEPEPTEPQPAETTPPEQEIGFVPSNCREDEIPSDSAQPWHVETIGQNGLNMET
jgi:hypothetical protein